MVQWIRIRPSMQETRENSTCGEATKPTTIEPARSRAPNYWACVRQLLKPTRLEPTLCNRRSHRSKKPSKNTRTKESPNSKEDPLQKILVKKEKKKKPPVCKEFVLWISSLTLGKKEKRKTTDRSHSVLKQVFTL